MTRGPPRSTLFPYTPLFRSAPRGVGHDGGGAAATALAGAAGSSGGGAAAASAGTAVGSRPTLLTRPDEQAAARVDGHVADLLVTAPADVARAVPALGADHREDHAADGGRHPQARVVGRAEGE